jgi:hypothetical protein
MQLSYSITTSLVFKILPVLSSGAPLRISVWKKTTTAGLPVQTQSFLATNTQHGFQAAAAETKFDLNYVYL